MRRKNREITDFNEITELLGRCQTIRLGMFDHEYPYVVPVSFGMEVKDGTAVVYFHGAKAGQKVWLLDEDSRVCVEADILDKIEETKTGITARYESVIGFGNAVQVADKEKIRGLKLINEHYGYPDHPLEVCGALENTAVYKVELKELTGKRNRRPEA